MNDLGKIRTAGVVGILVACTMIAADLLLLYTPRGDFNSSNYAWMAAVPFDRMLAGHTMGILVLPLYFIAFWHIYKGLNPSGGILPLLTTGSMVYATAIGIFYHGSIAYPSLVVQRAAVQEASAQAILHELVQQSRVFSWPAQGVVLTGMTLASVLLFIVVIRGRTLYPRWFAAVNPILMLLVLTLAGTLVPAIGQFVLPAAQNIPLAALFVVSTCLLWNGKPADA
jgi:hypothetical protein